MILKKENGLMFDNYMKKKSSKFEEEYFKGDKSIYASCYEYKAGNISMVYRERALRILQKNVPKNARVLDAACAFGDLLALLDQSNFITYGIDISEYALKRAKKNTRAELVLGDLNKTLPYKSNFFDAVFALDVIEHLESPYRFLLESHRILKKKGILFVQTPNINSFFEKIYKDKWFAYSDETHLHLFNRKSLRFLVQKSGFSVLYNQTISAPFPLILRTLLKNTDIGGNIWMVARKV